MNQIEVNLEKQDIQVQKKKKRETPPPNLQVWKTGWQGSSMGFFILPPLFTLCQILAQSPENCIRQQSFHWRSAYSIFQDQGLPHQVVLPT